MTFFFFSSFKAMISWPDLPWGEATTLWWQRCERGLWSLFSDRVSPGKAGTEQMNLHT